MEARQDTAEYVLLHGALTLQGKNAAALDAWFAADAARVLHLFCAAAATGAPVAWELYCAAQRAAPSLGKLPGAVVARAAEQMLQSEYPQALAPLIAAGGLAAFGFSQNPPCLHPLAALPKVPLVRWWAFLRLCGAREAQACRLLALPARTARGLAVLSQAFCAAPQDMASLKLMLCHGFPVSYPDAVAAFCLFAPARWQNAGALYTQLWNSGEPFMQSQLAITPAELRVEGVRGRKVQKVMDLLLQAVIKAPHLNYYPTLAGMAKMMARVL